ncbi:hypothetical protein KTE49_20575 [Burkholderia multivorans]|uniref:Putative phage repressor n=1 Tax=Burkholderia multivorans CGD2 TaxID=513052 RepID=B9BQI3_9BURK|nr:MULTISPECIES: hypothetical protein [Burkholderia cepacia complex]EEE06878.1 putative phage repressor [Burkholderia multivorans CGD2]EEE13178.1 putative phage repressor [Burkholderia multivorans CGD2M]MBU9532833.1 hypothetical protein [Burkholderia multivorans]MBY4752021.1 hypothetical protein [Burkholderia dolosa]
MTDRYQYVLMPAREMAPRVKEGEAVVFDTQDTPRPQDDVLVELENGNFLIRSLVSMTDSAYRLRQYSPAAVTTLARDRVKAIYPIVGRIRRDLMRQEGHTDA